MAFPFSITHKRKLKANITPEDIRSTLQYIEAEIRKRKANNIQVGHRNVSYKGSNSYWRGALFSIEDRGVFTLINDADNTSYLIFESQMHQIFIFTSVMAVFVAIISQKWWIGVLAFAWLCGMNWVITLIRNGFVATEIADGLDRLQGVLPEVKIDEKKSEELKSWF